MKRLTSNNTFEMDPVQLALNQVYIQDGWAWYQGGVPEHDVSVCDLIRTAADTLLVELPMLSDEDLSHLMADCLQYGEDEPEGVLAILYRALCAQAELRDKLSRYEDTGLEPEDIAEATEALGTIPFGRFRDIMEAERAGRLTILPPNDPLTLSELREMDGEPVWITPGGFWALVIAKPCERVRLICNDGESVWADKEIELVGPVYRRKPEEAAP